LNRLTIQGAESLIISDRKEDWIADLVKEYKDWNMDSGAVRIPFEGGSLVVTKMRPRQCAGRGFKSLDGNTLLI
jgi:hypothetical protein